MALLLATRFGRPWAILAGMVVAILANHLLAVGLGVAIADRVPESWMRWGVAILFIAMAAWLLIPDHSAPREKSWAGRSAFAAALVTFFLAEMGDKTQIATLALAARYDTVTPVLIGSALGSALADAPVIWLGERVTRRLPGRWLRGVSAALFLAFGAAVLAGW